MGGIGLRDSACVQACGRCPSACADGQKWACRQAGARTGRQVLAGARTGRQDARAAKEGSSEGDDLALADGKVGAIGELGFDVRREHSSVDRDEPDELQRLL